jgi:predicted small lipoprotein YifL
LSIGEALVVVDMGRKPLYVARKGGPGLNRWPVFFLASFLAALIALLPACGKKGPPFLTESKLSLRVDQLKAERENGRILLKGYVRGEDKIVSSVTGCRVYHAWYTMDNPPCEGCPIEMTGFEEIKEKVVSGDRFNCEILDAEKKGIHFFEVRLMGKNGALGPPSDKAKFTIVDR